MEAENSDRESDDRTHAENDRKPGAITCMILGCGALLLGAIVIGLIMTVKLGHDMTGLAVVTPPGKTVGGKAYVACSGFVDSGCDYYVASTDIPDVLFSMTTWSTESPFIGALCFSGDGKLVVTESDLAQYNRSPSRSGLDSALSEILYTHAYDFETEEYIAPISEPKLDNLADLQATHARIAALMKSHGGIVSKFTLTSDSPTRIPLGFWEAHRWWAKVRAGQDRNRGR